MLGRVLGTLEGEREGCLEEKGLRRALRYGVESLFSGIMNREANCMKKTCRYCGEAFTVGHMKPGRIDVCYKDDCQAKERKQVQEPSLMLGCVAWENKHTPVVTVTHDRAYAQAFNNKQKRMGHGVTRSIVASREPSGLERWKEEQE